MADNDFFVKVNSINENMEDLLNAGDKVDGIDEKIDDITQKHSEVLTTKEEIDDISLDLTQKNNEIKNLNTEIVILAAGSTASANYNSDSGLLTLRIPQVPGVKGDRGDSFKVDIFGTSDEIDIYNNTPENTSFLAVDTSILYFKISDAQGDWSAGVSFGKGDKGDSVTIAEVIDNEDYTFTWIFSDGESFTTSNLRGEKGDEPAHEIGDNKIRFVNPDGTWGEWISLAPNGFLENSTTLGDIVVPANTNKAVLNPITFTSLTIGSGSRLKLI